MSINHVPLAAPLLDASQEVSLCRAIEAGRYAEHLASSGRTRPPIQALQEVAAAGRAAMTTLWESNLRLVMVIASRASRRHGLPVDELFQEGCLGLAEAIMRFDFARGYRFSTYAHDLISHRVSASASRRGGALDGPLYRLRVRQALRAAAGDREPDDPQEATVAELARRRGISDEAAHLAQVSVTSLDELSPEHVAVSGGYDAVDQPSMAFLGLMGWAGELLRVRFGIGCVPMSRQEAAARYGIPATTLGRLEQRALRIARRLLDQDMCRLVDAA